MKNSRDVENPNRGKKGFCTSTKVFLLTAFVAFLTLTLLAIHLAKSQKRSKSLSLELSIVEEKLKEIQHVISSANISFPRTCEGYQGHRGIFVIDPSKGFTLDSQFEVNCAHGSTMVVHDKPNKIDITSLEWLNNFYNLNLNYNASLPNIKHLLEVSVECYQELAYKTEWQRDFLTCHWIDFNGKSHTEFGKITSKELLPVKGFQCEDVSYFSESGTIQISPLICQGTRKDLPKYYTSKSQ